jgi:hypothetical protein
MYRIELSPGEETVFRSIEELAVAIKRGVVTARARIWHHASSKWLPIQFHPHYKVALTLPLTQAALVAGPQAKPLSALNLELPPEAEPEIPPPAPAAGPAPIIAVAAESSAPKKKKKVRSKPAGENRSRRRSKPRRQLRVALIGALLIGGAQWVLSAPLFSRAKVPLLMNVQRQLGAAQDAMRGVTPPNTAGMIPVLPASAAAPIAPEGLQPAAAAPGRVTAPSFGGKSSIETGIVDIEAAPPSSELPVATLPAGDSLAPRTDSTGRKTLQGILTTVSGSEPPPVRGPTKH